MDSTPGEVIQEGFLVKHCPNAIGPSSLDKPWKPRYFVLKGKHLLYWKKKQHAQQSPNSPHCIVELDGSTVERVSLVFAKPPPFPYCLCLATGIVHKGSFLTYHLCTQDEDTFHSWFANLRKAAGLPEMSSLALPKGKVHIRSLSTGGGLGATQKQPLRIPNSPVNRIEESITNRSRSLSNGESNPLSLSLPGVLTERHFQVTLGDRLNESTDGDTSTDTLNPEKTLDDASLIEDDAPAPPPRKLAMSSTGLKTTRQRLQDGSSEPTNDERATREEQSMTTETNSSTSGEQEQKATETPPKENSNEETKVETQTEGTEEKPKEAEQTETKKEEAKGDEKDTEKEIEQPKSLKTSKQEEIQSQIARARQRVLELEKNNKLTPPSTVLSRALSTRTSISPPKSSPWTSLLTNRFAILLVLLLILYWYFF